MQTIIRSQIPSFGSFEPVEKKKVDGIVIALTYLMSICIQGVGVIGLLGAGVSLLEASASQEILVAWFILLLTALVCVFAFLMLNQEDDPIVVDHSGL